MTKYIKVIDGKKTPFVTTRQNETFYKKRGAKIEEPTREEIEKYFPEEKKQILEKSVDNGLVELKKERDELYAKLEDEVSAHAKTKDLLEKVKAKLERLKDKTQQKTEEDETT